MKTGTGPPMREWIVELEVELTPELEARAAELVRTWWGATAWVESVNGWLRVFGPDSESDRAALRDALKPPSWTLMLTNPPNPGYLPPHKRTW